MQDGNRRGKCAHSEIFFSYSINVVVKMALHTAYGSQFELGRRSSRYPLPALATLREIRTCEQQFIHQY